MLNYPSAGFNLPHVLQDILILTSKKQTLLGEGYLKDHHNAQKLFLNVEELLAVLHRFHIFQIAVKELSSLNVKLYQYFQHLLTDFYSIIVRILVNALHFYFIISGSGRLTSKGYLLQEN